MNTFHQTNHYVTSRSANAHNISGSFITGKNLLKTSNPDLYFRMDAEGGQCYQSAIQRRRSGESIHTEKFAFVIGSGDKGETYLYWKDNNLLYELPVSYWKKLNGWVNSPGYADGVINFNRPIIPRCLECHATRFWAEPPPENRFSINGYILGITCEKCHGPGYEHVHGASTNLHASSNIINPARLSRDRQMDICALCHAGIGEPSPLNPSFSFLPGEKLEEFVDISPLADKASSDVHGSQVELLKKSRCFLSTKMTCSTCHDVHKPEPTLVEASAHCLACHKVETCGMYSQMRLRERNCIDCHMPVQKTSLIIFNEYGNQDAPGMRSHWIKVYPKLSLP